MWNTHGHVITLATLWAKQFKRCLFFKNKIIHLFNKTSVVWDSGTGERYVQKHVGIVGQGEVAYVYATNTANGAICFAFV